MSIIIIITIIIFITIKNNAIPFFSFSFSNFFLPYITHPYTYILYTQSQQQCIHTRIHATFSYFYIRNNKLTWFFPIFFLGEGLYLRLNIEG